MNHEVKKHNPLQGFVLLGVGIVLLLYTLNLITEGINLILIIAAVGLIIYGSIISGFDEVVRRLAQKIGQLVSKKK